MNILFYSHFFKPETGAASVRADYFVKALRNAGHKVLVVTPKPNYPFGKIFDGFKKDIIINNKIENIIYLPILFVSYHSTIGRLLSYLSYFIFSFFYLLFHPYKPDIVISSSPPIITSLAALFYSKFSRSKFIFDVRDIWPDIGIELGILKNKIATKGLFKIEKYILQNSDKIIVTAEGDKDNLNNKIGDSSKCEIIYNGADTEIFKIADDEKRKKIRNRYNLPINKKIIIYFGSYNHGMNDIDILGEFLTDERVRSTSVHFLSIGSGDNLENLLNKIEGKITYTSINSLPMEDVAELVAVSDISIIPRKNLKHDTGGNIPVKCFESWAAGIPVLLSNIEDAEVTKIFNKCNTGILVAPDNVEVLVNGLENLLQKDLASVSHEARKFVMENFDRKKQSEKINSIIKMDKVIN